MSKGLWALVAVVLAVAAPAARAAEPNTGRFSVTNETQRIVDCNLLINGSTRTYLHVHPGKTYADDILVGRTVQLVCMRGKEGVYGPLKLGVSYRFVDAPSSHVDVVAAE
jgi:hypothetical protein